MVLTRAAIVRVMAAATCLVLGACLASTPPQRLPTATPVALLVHLEGADGHEAAVPESVLNALKATLAARNLTVVVTAPKALGDARTTDQRLAALTKASDAPCAMLVEARARFFSQLSGRYRWEVEVRTSFVAHDRTDFAQASDLSVAAFLQFEHEAEPEALAFVRRQLVDDVAALVDRALATHSR